MRTLALRLVLLAFLVLPGVAAGQAWLADRDTREGPGIKVGESLMLHPGALVEGGYDTNPLRRTVDYSGAGRLRLSSYLDLATRTESRRGADDGVVEESPPKTNFRFGLAGYYDFFFSDSPPVDKQDDFGIDSHLNLVLFPAGPYSFFLNMLYMRSVQPYESPEEFHARQTVKPGIGFQGRPGGGTLMLSFFYDADVLLFEDKTVANKNNKVTHDLRFETSWKILPKTSFVSMVKVSPTIYSGDGFNNNSNPLRGLFGIQGLMTPHFGLSLLVGYGASFYEAGDDYEGFIANGELMFFITPLAMIRLGGQHDFVDSFYANFYVRSGGYLSYVQMFGNVFQVTLKGDAYYRDYSEFTGLYMDVQQTGDRADVWVGGTLLLEFRITEWLAVLASAIYQGNLSSFSYNTAANGSYPVEFHRFEAMGGIRAYY